MQEVNNKCFIASLDVGTTTIRCQIINSDLDVVSSAITKVHLLYPKPGYVEIDPDELWNCVLTVIKDSIRGAGLSSTDIKCLGISTQRGTFITFQRDTGVPFHNFITWKDMRSKSLVQSWNQSLRFKAFRSGAYLVYLLSRNRRYLMASDLKLSTTQCTCRLLWVLENIPNIQSHLNRQNVCFATIESWLVHKLTGSDEYVSDVTNASSTGLFDPFLLEWSNWPKQLLNIPLHIFPKVVSNDHDFGSTAESIFGATVPIRCVIADQQASMFASCYFSRNNLKVTLGTGSFVDLNCGDVPHASVSGLYPLVGWKFKSDVVFLAEAACNDTGSLIQWILSLGIIENPEESSSLALGVENSDGVYFIPAFSGLGPPISDEAAASGFFGVKPTTKKAHLVRAVLESIVYRIILSYNVLRSERNETFSQLCVDGGVSNNDFICQMLADMSGLEIIRLKTHDLSVMGVALIAAINSGVLSFRRENDKFNDKIKDVFAPDTKGNAKENYYGNLNRWLDVVERYKSWY